ncbi:hypothetical protein COCON_G00117210 [Conger conger]|uniref:Uncharacterized protein n=1 Tax=Conger conger TaxID=82655 RepID=A0A9Q1DG27_CONCO|nr:hypothetical protein COCON_G00117210 [Conger conger]
MGCWLVELARAGVPLYAGSVWKKPSGETRLTASSPTCLFSLCWVQQTRSGSAVAGALRGSEAVGGDPSTPSHGVDSQKCRSVTIRIAEGGGVPPAVALLSLQTAVRQKVLVSAYYKRGHTHYHTGRLTAGSEAFPLELRYQSTLLGNCSQAARIHPKADERAASR